MDKKTKMAVGASLTLIMSVCCCCSFFRDKSATTNGIQGASGTPSSPTSPPPPLPAPVDIAVQVAAANAAIEEARALIAAGNVDQGTLRLVDARAALDEGRRLNAGEPSLALATHALDELTNANRASMAAAGPIRAATLLADNPPEDLVSEFEALPGAIQALEGIPTDASATQVRAAGRLKTRLERRLASIRDRALDTILDRRIVAEGMIRVTARDLADEFRSNEVRAENRYNGRKVAVDGSVDDVSTDLFGNAVVHLRTTNRFMPVDAQLDRHNAGRLSRGDRAILGCTCSGAVIGRPNLRDCELLVFYH